MTICISTLDDIIDSRDVIARIEELEAERESLADAFQSLADDFETAEDALSECVTALNNDEAVADDSAHSAFVSVTQACDAAAKALAEWDNSEEAEELKVLKALAEEASGSPDWEYGETLIRETYFQDYAEELANDCGMVPEGLTWPCNCIDWEQAARELAYDYFHVDFDGVTYLIRS